MLLQQKRTQFAQYYIYESIHAENCRYPTLLHNFDVSEDKKITKVNKQYRTTPSENCVIKIEASVKI